MRGTVAERFEHYTCPDPNTGCLLWWGAAGSPGYGTMHVGRYGERPYEITTRVAWWVHYGMWPKYRLFSRCRQQDCVEVTHLIEAVPGRVKPCIRCGSTKRGAPSPGKPLGDCLPCGVQRELAFARSFPDHALALSRKYTYHITEEQQYALLDAQGWCCANPRCRAPLQFRAAHVDHDHACCPGGRSCGKCIRGFLCRNCNSALGHIKDSEQRLLGLLDYLQAWRSNAPR